MTFPNNITTTTLTAGPAYTATGEPLEIRATITPLLGPARRITYADGTTITGAPTKHHAGPGEQITVTVPTTDQDGWTDPAGNTVTGWGYRATITTSSRSVTATEYTVTVVPTTADGTLDLDHITDPTNPGIVEPTTVNAYALKSEIPEPVNLAGYVTEGELSTALEELPTPEPVDLTPYALTSDVPGVTVDRTSGVRVFLGDPGGNVMLFGDTGWRNITGQLAAGTAYRVMLRRVGQSVFLEIENWRTPTAGASNIYVLPHGWKPPTNAYMPSVHGGSRTFRSWFIGTNGNVGINNAAAVDENTSVRFQWATDEPWPTTLPGTAA